MPGSVYEFSQPIQLRFNELISGVRSDVAVKVFGDDMQVLNDTAEKISKVLQGIDGASEVKVEQTTGLPVLTVDIDRDKAARFGLNVGDIQDTVATALGGRNAGTLFEGDRRFDIVIRLPETLRADLPALSNLLIPLPPNNLARIDFIRCRTWRASSSRRDRTRSAGRTASGASWSAPTCAAATSARSCWKRNRSCRTG